MMMTDDEFFIRVISQEDLVEQYAEGEMQGEIKEKFEQTFLSTPEGRDQVMITKELLRYNSAGGTPEPVRAVRARNRPVWSAVFQSPYLRIAALMLIFAGITFGIYRAFFYRSDADRGLAELSRAYAVARPTEARLAGFDYAPWSVSRSGDNRDDRQKAGKAYAERLLRDAVYYKPGAESTSI